MMLELLLLTLVVCSCSIVMNMIAIRRVNFLLKQKEKKDVERKIQNRDIK